MTEKTNYTNSDGWVVRELHGEPDWSNYEYETDKFIIPPKKRACSHSSCGDAYQKLGAVMNCSTCKKIVEAFEAGDPMFGWYWKVRSQRWLNRKLKKLEKNKSRNV